MTPTDPAEAALLAAILETPEDDVPRLVYADWLDEHADDPCPGCAFLKPGADLRQDCPDCDGSGRARGRRERAEFVRLDIERHRRWPDFARTSSWERSLSESGRELIAIESRLLDLYGADSGPCRRCDWHAPIPHGGWSWQFARGFVESVSAPLDALLPPCGLCGGSGWVFGDGTSRVPCEPCGGSGWVFGDGTGRDPCEPCGGKPAGVVDGRFIAASNGTGRDPGVLRALFGGQPVLTVTVVGREPWPGYRGYEWNERARHELADVEQSFDWVLPKDLLDAMARLYPSNLRQEPGQRWFEFPTRAAALAALSAAVVAYGRSVAGLPAIAGRTTTATEETPT